MENIYTPMEKVLVDGAKVLSTKEEVAAALETKQNFTKALELDLMLLELEAKMKMMDGLSEEMYLL